MTRIVLTYGLVSGLVIVTGIILTVLINGQEPHGNVWLGYLIMLIAMSAILLGVKQHRDQALGGVIRFWPALKLGLGVALIASLTYVAVWEVYLAMTDYVFMDRYIAATLQAEREAGASPADYAALERKLQGMGEMYANPLLRMPMTFAEIFPVGLLVSLVSAALLRNSRFLPARAAGRPGGVPAQG
jgi:hypothetical protein